MAYANVLYAVSDRIATLTVNRPDKLNALNDAVMADIGRPWPSAKADPAVGVLVVTGAGEKAFVAGADIGELAKQTVVGGKEKSLRGQVVLDAIEGLGKPVLAAINGYAFGGGLELALACHLRYAASTTRRWASPRSALGIIPGYGGTQRLPRIVGRGSALEMILSGQPDRRRGRRAHRPRQPRLRARGPPGEGARGRGRAPPEGARSRSRWRSRPSCAGPASPTKRASASSATSSGSSPRPPTCARGSPRSSRSESPSTGACSASAGPAGSAAATGATKPRAR